MDETGGHPRRAHLPALQQQRILIVADDKLHAPAADVHDQMRAALKIHRMPHAHIDQPRLIPGADHPHIESNFAAHPLYEVSPVLGFAHGAGCNRDDLLAIPTPRRRLESPQRQDRPVHPLAC